MYFGHSGKMKVVACKKKKLPFQSQLRRRRPLQNLQLHRLLIHLLIEFRSFSIWASFPVKFKQTPSYGRGVFHKICDLYLHYCYAYMIKIPKSGIVVQKLPSNVLKMPQQIRPVWRLNVLDCWIQDFGLYQNCIDVVVTIEKKNWFVNYCITEICNLIGCFAFGFHFHWLRKRNNSEEKIIRFMKKPYCWEAMRLLGSALNLTFPRWIFLHTSSKIFSIPSGSNRYIKFTVSILSFLLTKWST